MADLEFDGLIPAIVTPFKDDETLDINALETMVDWLSGIDGVTGLFCLGHAGEGAALSLAERRTVLTHAVRASAGRVPVIAGVLEEGTRSACDEAARAVDAGASALLVYPPHGWLRFGYQEQAPVDRYRRISEAVGAPLVLFQYPDRTQASYRLQTIMDICASSNIVAIKNGVRNMVRWDTEVPAIRREFPKVKILTCEDEYLLHTMWAADGCLVGFGSLIPEALVALYGATRRSARYGPALSLYSRLQRLTTAVYHRDNHLEATVALKVGLVARGILPQAAVRSPLFPLCEAQQREIVMALADLGLSKPDTSADPQHHRVEMER